MKKLIEVTDKKELQAIKEILSKTDNVKVGDIKKVQILKGEGATDITRIHGEYVFTNEGEDTNKTFILSTMDVLNKINDLDKGFKSFVGVYEKKPVRIEAMQFTRENARFCVEFTGGNLKNIKTPSGKAMTGEIKTLESGHGTHIAQENDFIIKGVSGEFYPCKPDIFKKTYKEVK